MQRRTIAVSTLAIAAVALSAGCSSSSKSSTSPSSSATAGGGSISAAAVSGTIMVFAASSLKEAFTTLGKLFEAAHPGTKVKLNFDASSALSTQITQGAPADVLASASTKNMDLVTKAGDATTPTTFVKNVMEIAVPPKNPGNVKTVADLAKHSVKVALCQLEVPCGATAQKVFANAKITVKPVTLEADVKSTLAKVELNEVDAGVVYVTDVRAAGSKVRGIPIPATVNASTEYPIATLTKGPNAAGGKAFTAYVLSGAGRKVLTADGFQQP
jgi:molybdate transport system substrate-binding protein